MSNLYNKNIGINYKGILNLDTTINTPLDATLRAVTDGMGTASPLQLSTVQAAIINGINYKSLFIGGGVASVKYSSGIDHTANGWMSGLNGNSSAYYSISYGTSALYSTTALALNTNLDVLINRNLYIGYNDAAFPTPSARLHVKANGGIAGKYEDSSGVRILEIGNGGYNLIIGNNNDKITGSSNSGYFEFNSNGNGFEFIKQNSYVSTSGNISYMNFSTATFAAPIGSANFKPVNVAYTINNSGAQTGNATGIFLNATETALNGMTHNLMDLQVGGVSKFKVANTGDATSTATVQGAYLRATTRASIDSFYNTTYSNEYLAAISIGGIYNLSATQGKYLFSGITNLFPMIKRNGAAIDFRLADDSGYCNVYANGIIISSGNIELSQTQCIISNIGAGTTGLQVKANGSSSVGLDVIGSSTTSNNIQRWRNSSSVTLSFIDGLGGAMFGGTTKNASAFVQIDSTTQGFLMPRMTDAQILAIVSPENGLMVYNITQLVPCFYDGTGWKKVVHLAM